MRTRDPVLFLALTALIFVLFATAPVTAGRMATGLNGHAHSINSLKTIPAQLNYQGSLIDAVDSSAVTATLEMTFRLFDSQTKGAELWFETHSLVAVSEGLFQVLLGSVTPFPNGLFDGSELWLQTEVGPEMLAPRKLLVSTAYSLKSGEADHATTAEWTSDAQHAIYADTADYGISGGGWTVSGDIIYRETGKVGIGTSGPLTELDVSGSVNATTYYGDGSNLTGIGGTADNDWTISGNDIYHQTGRVGIGTTSPTTLLHISQDATAAPGTHPHTKMIIEDGNSNAYLQIMAPASNTRALLFGESGAGGQVNDGQIGYENVNGMRFWVDRGGSGLVPLQIQVDGDVVMNDGKVGIGTTSPTAQLEVRNTTTSGRAANFHIDDASNYSSALYATTNGSGKCVYGEHNSGNYGYLGSSNYGVYGRYHGGNSGRLGTYRSGVYGTSGDDYGVWGESSNGYGVYGWTSSGDGVYGEYVSTSHINYGILGTSSYGVYGGSVSGHAVHGSSIGGHAGYFNGDVHITGTLTGGKTVIDHPLDPENKLLRHNFVESPEHLLIYRGKAHLDGRGEAIVEMSDYFQALTKEDEASIHLTPVGRPFLIGAEWNSGFQSFTIYGQADREVFWEVLADRDDPVIHQLARPVEEDKGPENKLCDRGELLYPTAYGYRESQGKDYKEREEKGKFK
jgi:hypothetical protein